MRTINSCILFLVLILSSCAQSPLLHPNLVPTFSETPPATPVRTATPTIDYKTIILTPDDLFSLPRFEAWSTPDSENFCEHLPPPQIVSNSDNLSILSGRFVLCTFEWTRTAMDLDTGSLVSTDDPRGDIVMFNGRWGTEEKPDYGVSNWSNAYLDSAYILEKYPNHEGINQLSSAYCENKLQGRTDSSVINVEEGAIACIRTTEGRIAIIRVERIYPSKTSSAEFSFVILKSVIATPVISPTPTLTPGPSPTATNTPTNQELLEALDERTQRLFGDPASVVIDFLLEIQDSIRANNKAKLASLVLYPITIHSIDGKDVEIQNEEEFIANYDKIATPKWKGVILAQEPEKLFTNWQGIMVNRGEIWFGPVCTDGSGCQQTKYYIYGITNNTPW
jgi:hypothetical protein